MMKPAISAWSSGASTATVPNRWASTPPRSMSPTTTTGMFAARASPMFAKSVARRLISAGEPALAEHHVEFGPQRGQVLGDDAREPVAVLDVVAGAEGAHGMAPHHQL